MVIAEENRYGSRGQPGFEVLKPEIAQLRCVIDFNELLDRLNVVHGLFIIGSK